MINLKQEVEDFLNSNWSNTNDKEQNMQGRLYAWFLRFEQQGYVVEMETSIKDEHLLEIMPSDMDVVKPEKTEIDIFIHKKDMCELYAIELKWIYNKTSGWNVVDHLEEFEKDAKFCKWLVNKADFYETCSVVVYDFDESKQVKRFSAKKKIEDKKLFIGGDYPVDKTKVGYIHSDDGSLTPFMWHKLDNIPSSDRDYYYYIIPFQNKHVITTKVALIIEQIYGFDWQKCVCLVMQSSWWKSNIKNDVMAHANVSEITAWVCKEIDNNTLI